MRVVSIIMLIVLLAKASTVYTQTIIPRAGLAVSNFTFEPINPKGENEFQVELFLWSRNRIFSNAKAGLARRM